jgi:hypothetical protein
MSVGWELRKIIGTEKVDGQLPKGSTSSEIAEANDVPSVGSIPTNFVFNKYGRTILKGRIFLREHLIELPSLPTHNVVLCKLLMRSYCRTNPNHR